MKKGGHPTAPPHSVLVLPSDQFSEPFSASPTRKRQVFEAGRLTAAPVRGLRAIPAGRLTGMKLPKPTRRTSSPLFRESITELVKASSASRACVLLRPDLAAIADTSSALVIPYAPNPRRDDLKRRLRHSRVLGAIVSASNNRGAEFLPPRKVIAILQRDLVGDDRVDVAVVGLHRQDRFVLFVPFDRRQGSGQGVGDGVVDHGHRDD